MIKLASGVALVVCLAAQATDAQQTPSPQDEHEAAIRQLLGLTGVSGGGGRVLDELFEAIEKNLPLVPPALWEELRKSYATDEFAQLQVAIYKKHFSLEEIQGLIAFHQTPLGRKLVQVQPELLKEGMAVGQEFARRALERLRRQLEEKGYKTLTDAGRGHEDFRRGQRVTSELDKLLAEAPYSAYVQFIGVTQHDLYHAGQVAILRRAVLAARG